MTRRISEHIEHQRFEGEQEDAHGNITPSWTDPESVGIYAFDPGSVSEPREPGHDRVVVEPTVYLPARSVLGPRDRVTARGDLYEVEGGTREWRHPNGRVRGNVATLRRVDG